MHFKAGPHRVARHEKEMERGEDARGKAEGFGRVDGGEIKTVGATGRIIGVKGRG